MSVCLSTLGRRTWTRGKRNKSVFAVSFFFKKKNRLRPDPWSARAAVFWRAEHKAGLNSVHKAAQVCKTWQHY